jgi:cell division protein ZapA
MSEVKLMINGRAYGIACDDGQESRVLELGHHIDARLREISRVSGTTTETHLFLLTALMITDELRDMQDQMQQLSQQVASQQGELQSAQQQIATAATYQAPTDLPTPANDAQLEEMGNMVKQLSQRVATLASRIKSLA